jgi:hypothetical protein
MITAQQARELAELQRETTKDDFLSRHTPFMVGLEKAVKANCTQYYLQVSIRESDNFTEDDFRFLMKYLSEELKFKTRSGDDNNVCRRCYSFEIWWSK